MVLYMGDDWAEDHHDVQLMDESGERLAARRLPEGVAGVTALHELVAQHAAGPGEVVIGIETDRGPWVSALVAAGYHVYAINPRSAARYRDRHHVGGAKSDAGDARLLADLVRTDRHNHRPVAGDSDDAGAVRILARAHQQLIWDRVRQTNRLRNALREYFPGALEAFPKLAHGDAVGVLSTAPGPREAARLSISQTRSALRRGGRQRSIERRAAAIREALRSPQLEAPPAVSKAFAASTRAAVGQISEINRQIKELEAELAASFEQHPDAGIYRSLPGLGVVLGARVLGEFGDDPERYDSAKSRRNYAGTSPLTLSRRNYLAADGSIRPQANRAGPLHPQPAALRRRRPVGDVLAAGEPGLPRLLRPAARRRRPPPPGVARPRQPPRRLSARLPEAPPALRRDDRLGSPLHPRGPRCLTL